MKNRIARASALFSGLIVVAMFSRLAIADTDTARNQKILATTYPIFLFTEAVVRGDDKIDLELLIAPSLGCPHNYVISPQDMKRIGQADIIIKNGLGLDDGIVAGRAGGTGSKAITIDSSRGLKGILQFQHDPGHGQKKHHHGHVHQGPNPHMFASPWMAAKIARNIATDLGRLRPGHKALYEKNAAAFETAMTGLGRDFVSLVRKLKNNRIVTQHGAFDYLARDAGLEIVAVVRDHPGYEPSAAEMIALVRQVAKSGAGAIYAEPQYPPRVPKTIAAEAGIAFGILDPVASGPEHAGFEYYEKTMRANRAVLEKTIGTR